MAAATVEGSLFSDNRYPRAFPAGPTVDRATETIATAQLADDGDITKLLPMRGSRRILQIILENADLDTHATPTLDADLTLVDDNGTTILVNAGTLFQSATLPTVYLFDQEVVATENDAYIGFEVNTAAATAAAVAVTVHVMHEGSGGG